jgi:hypothetical protein
MVEMCPAGLLDGSAGTYLDYWPASSQSLNLVALAVAGGDDKSVR